MINKILKYALVYHNENSLSIHFKRRLSETLDGNEIFMEMPTVSEDNEINDDDSETEAEIITKDEGLAEKPRNLLCLIGEMVSRVSGVSYVEVDNFEVFVEKGLLFSWNNVISDAIANILLAIGPSWKAEMETVTDKEK